MIYHIMNKAIGTWGEIMYVHNTVPGVIALIYPNWSTILYGLRMNSSEELLEGFRAPECIYPIEELEGHHLDNLWGWKDIYIGAGYRFHATFDLCNTEYEITRNFELIERVYRHNKTHARSNIA
jgi:hypothetical protein